MKNRIFRYSGSKFRFLDTINNIITSSHNSDVFIEPFVGSGVVFLNVPKFKRFIINDIDRNVIRIYRSFQVISYDYYLLILNNIHDVFGSIKDNKDSYYNFRNWFNEHHWNSDTIDEGIYLMFLANSCINSFLRFGPNGMNQSFGHRGYHYTYDYDTHQRVFDRLQNTEIYNLDYLTLKQGLDNNQDEYSYTLFIDPPYIGRNSSYESITPEYHKKILNTLQNVEFYYTDIYNDDIINTLKCDYRILRENMINTGPHTTKKKNNNTECIFFNSMYIN